MYYTLNYGKSAYSQTGYGKMREKQAKKKIVAPINKSIKSNHEMMKQMMDSMFA